MSNWQPIETAPKDGTHFLCYFTQMKRGVKHHVGWFGPAMESGKMRFFLYGVGEFLSADVVPTHWMPLPEPPEGEP